MVNVYQIDLEYLQQIQRYYLDPNTRDRVERTIQAQLEPLSFQPLEQRKNTLVIGTLFWEFTDLKSGGAVEFIDTVLQRVNELGAKFHLVTRTDYKNQIHSILCPVTYINFFALRTHLACREESQKINSRWEYNNKKTLFLMGKYYKPHRLGLLFRLYKQGLLNDNRCVWSLYQTVDEKKAVKYIPQYLRSQNSLDDFLKVCHRTLDNIKITAQDVGTSHYGGFPFDSDLYKSTNLSLISETRNSGPPFITEKTYRAIVNNHPFIIAGSTGQLQALKDQGFYTFEEFMKFSEYDTVDNLDYRLDAIVENVKYFDPDNLEIKTVTEMVSHNARHFEKLVATESDKLLDMLLSYGIIDSWENIIPWKDTQPSFLSWQFYYQTIKDPSWPACYTLADCNNLPVHIQQELKAVFNLTF